MNFATLLATGPTIKTEPRDHRKTSPKVIDEDILAHVPGTVAGIAEAAQYGLSTVRRALKRLAKEDKVKVIQMHNENGGKRFMYEHK